jgi:chromosome segregation ATPase
LYVHNPKNNVNEYLTQLEKSFLISSALPNACIHMIKTFEWKSLSVTSTDEYTKLVNDILTNIINLAQKYNKLLFKIANMESNSQISQKYKELVQKYNDLTKENNDLKSNIALLKDHNDALKNGNDLLNEKYKSLCVESETLKSDYEIVVSDLKKKIDCFVTLRTQIENVHDTVIVQGDSLYK